MKNKKKIGILGGSFDPIHQAHVHLGLTAKRRLNLDEVWILIDKEPRGKNTIASYADRLRMAKLATSSYPFFVVDKLPMQQNGKTHDHNSIIELKDQFPDYSFTMIMGLDTMMHFHSWENPEVFCDLVDFAIAARLPHTASDIDKVLDKLGPLAEKFNYQLIDFPQSSLSSTHIRNQLRSSQNTGYIHPDVREYISRQQLYLAT